MARIGASGAHPQNLQRDLLATFGKPRAAPDVTWVHVEMKSGPVLLPVLLPHRWFASLSLCSDLWAQSVTGPRGLATAYWDAMRTTAFVRNHDAFDMNDRHRTVPVGMHGDAG